MTDDKNIISNDHSFFDVVTILSNNLRFIVLITFLFIIFSAALFFIKTEKNYEGIIDIRKIQNVEMTKYDVINFAISHAKDANKNLPSHITSEKFLSSFINEFKVKKFIRETYSEYLINEAQISIDDAMAQAISFSSKISVDEVIKFKTDDINLFLNILERVIKNINNHIYSQLLIELQSIMYVHQFENDAKISELKNKLLVTRENFFLNHLSNVNHLQEQIKIAENLNIIENSFVYGSSNSFELQESFPAIEGENDIFSLVIDTDSRSLDYLRGSKALKEELLILESRNLDEISLYDDTYANLIAEYEGLKNNKEDKVFENAFLTLPSVEEFKSVIVDFDNLEYEEITKNRISIFILIILFGFISSCTYVVVIAQYRDYLKNKKT